MSIDKKKPDTSPADGVNTAADEAPDLDAVMRKYDRESATRLWEGTPQLIIRILMAAFGLFCIGMTLFSKAMPEIRLTMFVGCIIIIGFLTYPASKHHVRVNYLPWYDIVLMVVGAACFFYFALNAMTLVRLSTRIETVHVIIGVVGILVLMELCRRCVGLPILCVAGVLIVYAFINQLSYAGAVNGATLYDALKTIIYKLFYTTSGVIGTPISVCYTYIVLFIIFGEVMNKCGMGQFFNDIANALAGHTKGGPAKVAVLASGFLGSINGSAVANVVTTGTFTIPLMKKTGYSKEFAGSVEATASVGGQLLPPIMGAAAFVMAETLGVKYGVIIRAAVIPALLYYMGILVQVQMRATKENLNGLPKEQMPKAGQVMKERGHLLIPIAFLLYMLIWSGRTVIFSAFWTIIVTILVAELRPISRMSLKDICDAFVAGAKSTVPVAIACACVGIIVGVCGLTGFALNVAHAIIRIGQSSVLLTLVFTMITCMILGMGLPSIPSYLITATIAAPALVELGQPELAAHLFCFYYAMFANLTPPVALASFAAAGLSGGSPMKTGWQSVRLALAGFIIPYMFMYNPQLLLENVTLLSGIQVVITSCIGVVMIAAAVEGYLFGNLNWLLRIASMAGALLLIDSKTITDVIGIALLVVVIAYQKLVYQRKHKSGEPPAPVSTAA